MDADKPPAIEDEAQFWAALDDIVASPCDTHERVDDALRTYLETTTSLKKEYLRTEYDFARCCYTILDSNVFKSNPNYVRRQFLYCLLQEDDADTLHLAIALLLYDGRSHESVFEMMQDEAAFPRLIELIRSGTDDDSGLHRMLIELLFEMSRIQKLTRDDLAIVDDAFILYLFELIEELSDDAHDPYHYPIIRVLLVLNEQYMCLASESSFPTQPVAGPTNRVLKLLSMHGPSYRTFGENLILLLNRESELGPQLLILKLLYLLFTTPPTYEYFYTNDLHVLVDVIIRNLLDLDPGTGELGLAADGTERDGQRVLRHTYLRVLCPLLKNTQLAREENNYKREEVRKLLYLLVNSSSVHFAPVDDTIIRLVIRCREIEWLRGEGDDELINAMERRLEEAAPKDTDVAKKLLGMSLGDAGVSSLSVNEVSAKVTKQKPSVPAPRRNRKVSKPNSQANLNDGSNGNGQARLTVQPLAMTGSDSDISGGGTRSPFADDNEED